MLVTLQPSWEPEQVALAQAHGNPTLLEKLNSLKHPQAPPPKRSKYAHLTDMERHVHDHLVKHK